MRKCLSVWLFVFLARSLSFFPSLSPTLSLSLSPHPLPQLESNPEGVLDFLAAKDIPPDVRYALEGGGLRESAVHV